MTTTLDLIHNLTGLTFRRVTGAGEYAGPCPFCKGTDRFHIWPDKDRWHCLGDSAGRAGCDKSGDAIQFVRDFKGLGFHEACEIVGRSPSMAAPVPAAPTHGDEPPQQPPAEPWSVPAWAFVFDCQAHLMERGTNPKALAWLTGRGLTEQTLWAAGIGYNPADCYLDRAEWGLPPATNPTTGKAKRLWLPRGIVIPWVIEGQLWGVRIRRPAGDPKYYWIPGGTPALYRADQVRAGAPVVLLEGELDALTVVQEVGGLAAAVATGSTGGGRRVRWLARLAAADRVLVAYDADEGGEKAAGYWLETLPNAHRWRPYWSDANAMAQAGVDIRRWIEMGLQQTERIVC